VAFDYVGDVALPSCRAARSPRPWPPALRPRWPLRPVGTRSGLHAASDGARLLSAAQREAHAPCGRSPRSRRCVLTPRRSRACGTTGCRNIADVRVSSHQSSREVSESLAFVPTFYRHFDPHRVLEPALRSAPRWALLVRRGREDDPSFVSASSYESSSYVKVSSRALAPARDSGIAR
jgi:hypothetical protein